VVESKPSFCVNKSQVAFRGKCVTLTKQKVWLCFPSKVLLFTVGSWIILRRTISLRFLPWSRCHPD